MTSIIAKYYVESNMPLKKIADVMCAEMSTGTWTYVPYEKKAKKYRARTTKVEKAKKIVNISIPIEDFDKDNIPQLLSIVAGNIFGMKAVRNLRLLDLALPKNYLKQFKGPKFGIDGIRKITKVEKRPLLGSIVKPKIGLRPEDYANVVYEVASGGADLVKMDETLVNQKFCPLEKLVPEVMEKIDLVKEEKERNVLFAVNVTTRPDRLLELSERALALGANCLMVDIVCTGLSSIEMLRDENLKVPIYCHRAGHAAFTKNIKHGISWNVFARLSRMLGADVLHCGTIFGKMCGERRDILKSYDVLRKKYYGLERTLPAASGGIYPAIIPDIIRTFGKNILINAGGGIHGHPDGSRTGAAAMMWAIDAAMKGINLNKYAKNHFILKRALERWE